MVDIAAHAGFVSLTAMMHLNPAVYKLSFPPSHQDEGTSVDPDKPRYYYIAKELLTSERT